MNYSKTILMILIFCFYGCNSVSDNNLDSTYIYLLQKEWINSFEEETGLVKIFRPSDFNDFPISRYRQSFIFEENNKCKYYVLADNDGHYYANGTWELKNNNQLIVIYNSSNHIIYQLKIVELSENILKCIYVY